MDNKRIQIFSSAPQREPLFQAAKRGHVKATLLMLKANEDCCKQTDDEGQNCLMIAITGKYK